MTSSQGGARTLLSTYSHRSTSACGLDKHHLSQSASALPAARPEQDACCALSKLAAVHQCGRRQTPGWVMLAASFWTKKTWQAVERCSQHQAHASC